MSWETNGLGVIRLRTEVAPVSQTAGDDYALPEVTWHIAHLTDDEAEEQTENGIDEGDYKSGADCGNVVLGEGGDNAGEYEGRKGEVYCDLGGTPCGDLWKKIFPSKIIAHEHGDEAVEDTDYFRMVSRAAANYRHFNQRDYA
jgi:hypothetical protein